MNILICIKVLFIYQYECNIMIKVYCIPDICILTKLINITRNTF